MKNEDIGRRLKQARNEANLTLKDVARIVGVSDSTVLRYESGAIDKIKLPVIESIAKALGVNPAWVTLKSDDKSIQAPSTTSPQASWSRPLDDAYAAAPDHTQRGVCNVLKIPYVAPPASKKRRHMVSKIVYDYPSAAGAPAYIESDYERIDYPADEVPNDVDYGVRSAGSSMQPDIQDGDIVWVVHTSEISDGHVGICTIDGNAVCKRVEIDQSGRAVRLLSDNRECADIELTENMDFRVLGRVVGVWHEAPE